MTVPTESTFDEIKRYVRFDADAVERLRRFRPVAAPHFPRIAAEFYDRIREHEAAHAVLAGEEQIARLQRSLVAWLDRVCSGPHDESYFRETEKIGRVHVRVGLPQRYMPTAMALIRVALQRIADDGMGDEAPAVREAISRALDLDLAIMLEAYRDDFVARCKHVERLGREEASRRGRGIEHRYVGAVELARVLVVGLDAGGAILLFNREAERVTGFARDEVLGRSFAEAFGGGAGPDPGLDLAEPGSARGPAADDGAPLAAIVAAARAHEPASVDAIETMIRTRAGRTRNVRWQLAPALALDLLDEGVGKSPGASSEPSDDVVLFAIGRDVTDENARAARARQSERLASIGTLAAGLAHEIRNPLNGAKLHTTYLARTLANGLATADARAAVEVIRDEIERLSALVTEFLDFARPQTLERQPTSIRWLCERILSLLGAEAEAGKVRLACQHPTTDLLVAVDAAKMEQVLLNLGRNAVEALAPAGGGTVVFRVRRAPKHALIEVEDDGPGLADPAAPIFDPFFTTKPSGTGLGLPIAHRIVTDHGGAIDVQSTPGKTVFQITLPISTPAQDAQQSRMTS